MLVTASSYDYAAGEGLKPSPVPFIVHRCSQRLRPMRQQSHEIVFRRPTIECRGVTIRNAGWTARRIITHNSCSSYDLPCLCADSSDTDDVPHSAYLAGISLLAYISTNLQRFFLSSISNQTVDAQNDVQIIGASCQTIRRYCIVPGMQLRFPSGQDEQSSRSRAARQLGRHLSR
jgi:hypothetical protein